MGLMDRVKAQATQLAQQAQEAAQDGKARLDQAQAGRRGDIMLRQLGALVYAERTGRGTADGQARVDQLISDIAAHESQHGLNIADPPQAGSGAQAQPDFPGGSSAGPGSADAPSGDPGAMPPVDNTTSFFSAPDDEASGAAPQG